MLNTTAYLCSIVHYVQSKVPTYSSVSTATVTVASLTLEVYAPINTSVTLECIAHGNPRPEGITWRSTSSLYTTIELSDRANERVLDDYTIVSNLTLTFVTLQSRGYYTCLAYNEFLMTEMSDEDTVKLFVIGRMFLMCFLHAYVIFPLYS